MRPNKGFMSPNDEEIETFMLRSGDQTKQFKYGHHEFMAYQQEMKSHISKLLFSAIGFFTFTVIGLILILSGTLN